MAMTDPERKAKDTKPSRFAWLSPILKYGLLAFLVGGAYKVGIDNCRSNVEYLERLNSDLEQENDELQAGLQEYQSPELMKKEPFRKKKRSHPKIDIFAGRRFLIIDHVWTPDSINYRFFVDFKKKYKARYGSGDSSLFRGYCALGEIIDFRFEENEYYFKFVSFVPDTAGLYSGEIEFYRRR